MNWKDLPGKCKTYLVIVYLLAIPIAVLCFKGKGEYNSIWLLLTLASLFVATVGLRLPQVPSVVVSMGDVFTIVALMYFGTGPALVTYWVNILATAVTEKIRKRGFRYLNTIVVYRVVFNLACCTLSIFAMNAAYKSAVSAIAISPINVIFGLGCLAVVWFVVNTGTLSLAVSLSSGESFFQIWKQGAGLYVLNFFGAAAAAVLISQFYQRAGFSVFLLSLPLAVVIYQLYSFYIEKYQQARTHIGELSKLHLQTIEAMANAVDAKDRYTHGHIRRVQAYAIELAKRMGITGENELMAIQAGALLHDIGKIAIPEYILNKPTVLTESEYEKMKMHPVIGANMLSTIEFPFPLMPIVKSHHERWDGNGYPDRLKGDEIPLNARILSLVDCYDALTTNRPYRSPMARAEVIEFFRRESGRAYDPAVVQAFVDNLEQMEAAGRAVVVEKTNLWGIQESPNTGKTRKLEKVQPILAYGKALNAEPEIQRELYSVFEFARADFQTLKPAEIFSFIGAK